MPLDCLPSPRSIELYIELDRVRICAWIVDNLRDVTAAIYVAEWIIPRVAVSVQRLRVPRPRHHGVGLDETDKGLFLNITLVQVATALEF